MVYDYYGFLRNKFNRILFPNEKEDDYLMSDAYLEILILLAFIAGIYFLIVYDPSEQKMKMTLLQRIKIASEREIDISQMQQGRETINRIKTINFIRWILIIIVAFFLILDIKNNLLSLAMLAIFALLTSPKESIVGFKSPVKRILDERNLRRIQGFDDEIFSSAGIIKTLALLNSQGTFSADFIYEKIFEHSNKMKPVYSNFLVLYRGGRREEAFASIRKTVNSNTGKQFTSILEKLEYLSPKEMVSQIQGFQEGIVEERMTRATNEVDRNSVITTLASTATIFAIILNFAVVGILMDSLEMINGIF